MFAIGVNTKPGNSNFNGEAKAVFTHIHYLAVLGVGER
jgi:hypothetical protein